MKDVLKDIVSGALPVEEIPGYILFMVGRAFWPLIIVTAALVAAFFVIK